MRTAGMETYSRPGGWGRGGGGRASTSLYTVHATVPLYVQYCRNFYIFQALAVQWIPLLQDSFVEDLLKYLVVHTVLVKTSHNSRPSFHTIGIKKIVKNFISK